MQFKAIEYFKIISEEKSFSAAAERLYITQPALSQYIKKVEEELGAVLINRGQKTLQLTQSGNIFLEDGAHILQMYQRMREKISAIGQPTEEPVRFGISPFYSQYYLPRLLPPFIEKYPSMKYDIVEDISHVLEQKLISGELDFCALPLHPVNNLLEYEVIYKEEILIALPRNHPVNKRYQGSNSNTPYLDLKLLKDEAFIGLKSVQKFSQMGLRLCEEAGFKPNTICETLNWDTVNMLVSAGLGVGFVPEILIDRITDKSLRPCYYKLQSNAQRAYAIAKKREAVLSESAELLIDSFRQSFSQLPV